MRICFVALELLGPFTGGGIATSTAGQAEHHARDHDVTVLYVNHLAPEDAPRWEDFYARRGIRFVRAELASFYDLHVKMQNLPFAVKEYLAAWEERFDVIFFHDYRGLGYYAALARQLGLGFAETRIGTVIHGPSEWARPMNAVRDDAEHLVLYELERKQAEYSDFVVAPSASILDWCRAQGWRLPEDTRAISNLLPYRLDLHTGLERGERVAVEEICYFGRLEIRKGFFTFLDAVSYLHRHGLPRPRKVTFLGSFCINGFRNSAASVLEAAAGWDCEVEFLNRMGHEDAIRTLVERRPLVVLPSRDESFGLTAYECLAFGVPCLMAARGAMTTLAAEPERAEMLVEPEVPALARRIADCLEAGAVVGAIDPRHLAAEGEWDALLEALAPPAPAPDPRRAVVSLDDRPPAPVAERPLVSVVLVHHDRPALVAEALESLRAQGWAEIEILVVDDGSRPAARERLRALLAATDDPRIRLIEQENLYVGAARNRGAAEARGEFLLFMDDDNLALPHEVETFVGVARATGADLLTAPARIFRTVGGERRAHEIYLPAGPSLRLAAIENCFGDANAFLRRESFEALGGFTETYGAGGEDYELFTRAFLAGWRMQVVPEILFDYRGESARMTRYLKPTRYIVDQMRGAGPVLESDRATSLGELRPVMRYAFYRATAPEWDFWLREATKTFRHPELETELARHQKDPNGAAAVAVVAQMLAAEGRLSAALALLERNRIAAEDGVLARLQDLDARQRARHAASGVQPNAIANPNFEFWTLGPRVEGIRPHQYVANEWLVPSSAPRPGLVVEGRHELALAALSEAGADSYVRLQNEVAEEGGYLFLSQRLFEIGALLERELRLSFLARASWEGELSAFLQITEVLGTDRYRDIHPRARARVTRAWERATLDFDLRDIRPSSLPNSAFLSLLVGVPTHFVHALDLTDVVLVPLGEHVTVAPYLRPAEYLRATRRCFPVGRDARATPAGGAETVVELAPAQAERVSGDSRLHPAGPAYILGPDGEVRAHAVSAVRFEIAGQGRAFLRLALDPPLAAPGVLLRDAVVVTNYLEGSGG